MHGIPSTWNRGVWTRFYVNPPPHVSSLRILGNGRLESFTSPPSRYENPPPDPSRIISRVENLENVRTFDRHFEYRSRLFHSLVLGFRMLIDRGSIPRSYNFTRGKFRECILFLFHRYFDYYFILYILYTNNGIENGFILRNNCLF